MSIEDPLKNKQEEKGPFELKKERIADEAIEVVKKAVEDYPYYKEHMRVRFALGNGINDRVEFTLDNKDFDTLYEKTHEYMRGMPDLFHDLRIWVADRDGDGDYIERELDTVKT